MTLYRIILTNSANVVIDDVKVYGKDESDAIRHYVLTNTICDGDTIKILESEVID